MKKRIKNHKLNLHLQSKTFYNPSNSRTFPNLILNETIQPSATVSASSVSTSSSSFIDSTTQKRTR